jgi:predicted glutamine amidotransferase
MCELLGLCGSRPFAADVTMRAFGRRDERNADGWGLAWYVGRSLALVKEGSPWRESPHASFLAEYEKVRSSIFLAHVRRATVGRRSSRANAHPFEREIGGRSWSFAHNGTVKAGGLPLGSYRPIGETDSERLFCHLAGRLNRRGGRLDEETDWRWLARALDRLNTLGKMNCLLSDGRRLFVWRDAAGFKGLSMRIVGFHNGSGRRLNDPDIDIDLHGPVGDRVCAVATYPLSPTGWHDLRAGELLVLERGELVWSSERSNGEPVNGEAAAPAAHGAA